MGGLKAFQTILVAVTLSGCIGMPLAELKESPHVARFESPKSAEVVFRCVRNEVADLPIPTDLMGSPLSRIEATYYPEQRVGELWKYLTMHGHTWRVEIAGTDDGSTITRRSSIDWQSAVKPIDAILGRCAA